MGKKYFGDNRCQVAACEGEVVGRRETIKDFFSGSDPIFTPRLLLPGGCYLGSRFVGGLLNRLHRRGRVKDGD